MCITFNCDAFGLIQMKLGLSRENEGYSQGLNSTAVIIVMT